MKSSEWTACVTGVVAAIAFAMVAWRLFRWPAPAISVGVGFGAYWLARRLLADPSSPS